MIGFSAYFLNNPATCFFSPTLCNSTVPTRGPFYSEENVMSIKIPLLKGELTTAAVLFAFSLGYIIMFVVTWVRIENYLRPIFKPPPPSPALPPTRRLSTKHSIWHVNDITRENSSMPVANLNYSSAVDSTFASSLVKSFNRSRWSADSIDFCPIDI